MMERASNDNYPGLVCQLALLTRSVPRKWFSIIWMKEDHMSGYLLVLTIVIGFFLSGFTQFVDRGEYVEVSKGVKLCSNVTLDTSSRRLDSESRFWRVTSKARANGTQAVDAIDLESSYDRKSGETTIEEHQYDNYATLFKRAPEHKGMLLMVSPRDGQVEATVEICSKKK